MLEGDAEQVAARARHDPARTGSSAELMGDVLVYLEAPINGRLLAFARPLADAAGGALVAVVASGEPTVADGLTAADVVIEMTHPALSPYLPEAHQAVLAAAIRTRTPDLVLLENTTAGLRPRGRGGGHDGPPVRGLLRRPLVAGWRSAVGQRDLRRATSGHCRARRCRPSARSTRWRCTRSHRMPAAVSASSSGRPPSWTA